MSADDRSIRLRAEFLRRGITNEAFQDVVDSPELSFQSVFGARKLLLVEFDVILVGEHSHLVFVPDENEPCELITSFPERGQLEVSLAQPWVGSRHAPERGRGRHRVGIVKSDFDRDAWRRVADLAKELSTANLNYHFLRQNSNSVTATLLASEGLPFADLKGGGINPGARNILFDELAGGKQSRRLLFRGATSYVGHPKSTDAAALGVPNILENGS